MLLVFLFLFHWLMSMMLNAALNEHCQCLLMNIQIYAKLKCLTYYVHDTVFEGKIRLGECHSRTPEHSRNGRQFSNFRLQFIFLSKSANWKSRHNWHHIVAIFISDDRQRYHLSDDYLATIELYFEQLRTISIPSHCESLATSIDSISGNFVSGLR